MEPDWRIIERGTLSGVLDLKMGKQRDENTIVRAPFTDMSHALPQEYRRKLQLAITEYPENMNSDKLNVLLYNRRTKEPIGGAQGVVEGSILVVTSGWIHQDHWNRGLGTAMYEALYRVAWERGARSVRGSKHSTMARHLHQKLSKKHGWNYKAEPNYDDWGDLWDSPLQNSGKNDDRWERYSYDLSGVSKKKKEGESLDPAPQFQRQGLHCSLRAQVGLGHDSRHRLGVPGWLTVTANSALNGARLRFTFHPDKATNDNMPSTGFLSLKGFLQKVPSSSFPGEEPTFNLLTEQVMRAGAHANGLDAGWVPVRSLQRASMPFYMHVTLTGPLRDQLLVWIDGMVAEGLLS